MPVIVVGADTPPGRSIVEALCDRAGEIRAFVTDPAAARDLRERGIKVAVGDVSDGSHVAAAALACFSAVFVAECALDARERSFSPDPPDVVAVWADAAAEAAVHRVIWIDHDELTEGAAAFVGRVPEVATVSTSQRTPQQVGAEAARLDAAATL